MKTEVRVGRDEQIDNEEEEERWRVSIGRRRLIINEKS